MNEEKFCIMPEMPYCPCCKFGVIDYGDAETYEDTQGPFCKTEWHCTCTKQDVERIMLKEKSEKPESLLVKNRKEITEIKMLLITELCPHCNKENTIERVVKKEGYRAFCPSCGKWMMLCSECMTDEFCDYSSDEDICYRQVEEMWKELEDVPLDENEEGREYFEDDFCLCGYEFPAGTEKNDVWGWFNHHHPKGIAYLLNEFEEGRE